MDTRGQRRVKSLLLMYLLVVKAAGDCPKPEGGANTILTDESLLINEFPENIEVTLECSVGFIKERGSEVITCVGNEWTESDLVCNKKDCGQPPPKDNMSFNTSRGTLFGDLISVTCDKGYQITGSSYKQCYASGWIGSAKCERVECGTPPEIANGERRWDSEDDTPLFETSVFYTCHEGYSLIGNSTIVCSDTGEYSPPPPECKEMRTTAPAPTSQTQAVKTTTAPPSPSAASTVHGAKTNTTSTTASRSTLPTGFKRSSTAEGKAAATTVTAATSSSFKDMDDRPVATGNRIMPVAVSAIVVSLVIIIACYIWHKFSLRRKGSNGITPI